MHDIDESVKKMRSTLFKKVWDELLLALAGTSVISTSRIPSVQNTVLAFIMTYIGVIVVAFSFYKIGREIGR